MTRRQRLHTSLALVTVALVLGGCGEDPSSGPWVAAADSTCDDLDLPTLIADAYPGLGPARPSSQVTEDSDSSDALCQARVDLPEGGRLIVQAEVSAQLEGSTNPLYALRDGGEVGLDGAVREVEPEPVEGWWDEGVSIVATASNGASASTGLTVRQANLVVAVRVSDKRGPGDRADLETDRDLADSVADAVRGTWPRRDGER
jgi:hypothetical protein